MLATTASILWVSLLVALGFSLFAALLGAFTAVVVNALLRRLDPAHSPRTGLAIGLGSAAAVAVLLYALPGAGLGLNVSPEASETFWFWLGLPTLLYIVAGGIGGWLLAAEPSHAA
jgi:hypothetical protein